MTKNHNHDVWPSLFFIKLAPCHSPWSRSKRSTQSQRSATRWRRPSGVGRSGLGITFLTDYFLQDVESGRLRIVKTRPGIAPIQYMAVIRADLLDPLAERVAGIAQDVCDFASRRLSPRTTRDLDELVRQ